ncbi:LysR family transcriptional regulator [Pseudomonas sp. R5(2019)]|uniref:LysR family transcriptional regulator n=1 Tax=Pseudomonas sp. R5(2019) TaxID=2697566 RepID=UPI001412739F|nr:LysR family transcriptional regulator [Pseudomonas sp. R5(2019)]NBA97502.1 LysR family transcriptional regulator [Pseudomonas sp. R5(2019)]
MSLRQIDLNLLVSLDVLLNERNVTRAAERLHVSQPAMSAQLSRLRRIFDDPLLLPAETGRGMIPTARALALGTPLRSALKHLDSVISQQPTFDPLLDTRTFHVAASDNATALISLPLIQRLITQVGPEIRIAFRAPDPRHIAEQMEDGRIDLLVDAERQMPENMKTHLLLQERFVMAQRKGHPRGTGALDLDSYCSLRHVLVSSETGSVRGYMDETLQGLGRQRSIVYSVPQFILVPEILRHSDYVCTLPAMLLTRFSDVLDTFELPFPAPNFTLRLAWHPRNHADPAISWLRELIKDAVRSV